MTPRRLFLALALLGLAAAGCGGSAATAPPAPSVALTGPPIQLTVTAQNIELAPATMSVPAGRMLQVTFDNKDAGVPHDLVLKGGPGFTTELIKTEISTGVTTTALPIPGHMPGAYQFTCNVHPNMTASLTVGG
jgi:plastocyanin